MKLLGGKGGKKMKKILKKKIKASSNAVRYFSGELIYYFKPMIFIDGTKGICKWSCN